MLPGLTVFGLGLALMVAPLTATVLAAAPDEHAGIASGVNNAVARPARCSRSRRCRSLVGLGGQEYADPVAFDAAYGIGDAGLRRAARRRGPGVVADDPQPGCSGNDSAEPDP